jgi:4-hydroxyphenylacetate 3-monooxygenase
VTRRFEPDVATERASATLRYHAPVRAERHLGVAEDRRTLLSFARDLINSDYTGHRLTFQLFAQSPPFAHLAAPYRKFNWTSTLEFTQHCTGMSDRMWAGLQRTNKPSST